MIAGVLGMLIGAVDPLEGSAIILPGAALVALGAFVGKSRYRVFLYSSFVLTAIGVAAMLLLSQWGGFGGNSGRSNWWWLAILPYPAGWIIGLTTAAFALRRVSAYQE
jgi:hypothetical protein